MSRNSQQLGSPRLKIRIEGEDGLKPEQRKLIEERYQGEINKFYLGIRQQLDLSQQPGYKQFKALPDGGQLRYSYNHGQETMDIRLSPKALQEVTREEERKTPLPDYCVVDLVIPDSTAVKGDFIAKVVKPAAIAGRQETDSIHWTDDSETIKAANPADARLIVQYARDVPSDYNSSITNRVSSLLFDLRGDPNTRVEVDLYGKVTPNTFPIIGYDPPTYSRTLLYDHSMEPTPDLTIDTHTTYTVYDHVGGTTVYAEAQPSDADPSVGPYAPTVSVWEYEDRTTYPSSESLTDPTSGLVWKEIARAYWEADISGPVSGTCPNHAQASDVMTRRRQVLEWWKVWTINTVPGAPIYATTYTTTADVVHGFYYGDPKMRVGKTTHQDIRYAGVAVSWASIWSPTLSDPTDRVALRTRASLTYTSQAGNPGNYAYIGRVKVTRNPPMVEFTPA